MKHSGILRRIISRIVRSWSHKAEIRQTTGGGCDCDGKHGAESFGYILGSVRTPRNAFFSLGNKKAEHRCLRSVVLLQTDEPRLKTVAEFHQKDGGRALLDQSAVGRQPRKLPSSLVLHFSPACEQNCGK